MYTTGLILERRCDAYRLSTSFMLPMALVGSGGATMKAQEPEKSSNDSKVKLFFALDFLEPIRV